MGLWGLESLKSAGQFGDPREELMLVFCAKIEYSSFLQGHLSFSPKAFNWLTHSKENNMLYSKSLILILILFLNYLHGTCSLVSDQISRQHDQPDQISHHTVLSKERLLRWLSLARRQKGNTTLHYRTQQRPETLMRPAFLWRRMRSLQESITGHLHDLVSGHR